MKCVKMLGLASVAAVALVAFAGASSASATVLCKTTPGGLSTPCSANQAYPANTQLLAEASTTVKLDTTFKTVECSSSTIEGTTSNEGSASETVKVPVVRYAYGSCNCTVSVLKKGSLEIHWIEGTHKGTVTLNETETTVSCSTIFGTVHCIYVTENDSIGDITESSTPSTRAVFHATGPTFRLATNALCSEEGTLTATYEIVSPAPLYIGPST